MPTDDELYEQVVTKGRRLRRRRRTALGAGAAAAVVVVAVAAFGLTGGGGGDVVVADAGGSTTSTTARPEATTTTPTTATPTTTTSTVPTSTTEPEVVCRNSRDPVCGPFYWDPVPPNQPVTFTITFDPPQPVAGRPVTMTVEAHDPEAELLIMGSGDTASCPPDWGDGTRSYPGCVVPAFAGREDPPRTGPWDPPPPVGASAVGSFEHTYAAPGTYTITVAAMPLTSLDVQNTDYDVYGPTPEDHETVTLTVG